ncbi:MAG: signal recognition particle [Erysipelothrix sp.]|nr:signal recognition particle [Erysipelothrix sp.]
MSLDTIVYLNNLFDAYESLLTKRQQEVFRYYYHDDLSHQEIADILEISRAGVYDALKRTRDVLYETEEKLGFVKRLNVLITELKDLDDPKINEIIIKFQRGGNYE